MSSEVDSNVVGPKKEQQGRKMGQDEDQDESLAKGLRNLTKKDPSSGHHASPQTSSMEQTT